MSLRQNLHFRGNSGEQLSYQSECHCAKTVQAVTVLHLRLSYQSECHCAKTHIVRPMQGLWLSYQSECHCAKTL